MLCSSAARRVALAARPTWKRHALREYSQVKSAAAGRDNGEAPTPFDELGIRPVKRPDSAAYFMLRPKVSDMLAALRNMVQQLQRQQLQHQSQGLPQYPIQRKRWHKKEDLDAKFDFQISFSEYTTLIRLVSQAYGLSAGNSEQDKIVRLYLKQFQAGYKHVEVIQLPDPNKVEKAKKKKELKKEKKRLEYEQRAANKEEAKQKMQDGSAAGAGQQMYSAKADAGSVATTAKTKSAAEAKPTTGTEPTAAKTESKDGAKKVKKEKRGSSKYGSLDELGRWFASGRRKTAQAFAWITPVKQPISYRIKCATQLIDEVTAEVSEELEQIAQAIGCPNPKALDKMGDAVVDGEAATESMSEVVSEVMSEIGAVPAAAEGGKNEGDVLAKETGNLAESSANAEAAELETDELDADELESPAQVPGMFGEVLVNGRPLAEYFTRPMDREAVLFPFQAAERLGQFNVFVRVSGGGNTGQAEASQLAIARALLAADESTRSALGSSGVLRPDMRMVERKKTGKPKARRSYTWVKR
ncbi:37S ribosomal protein S9, mitochondrial [Coemansia guatemalensis]|uniref:37S ribosomal protein S9, mitochondrial n=1 Tax=Coemansia guatemalensis TaxID=2761395 RepID=A0A9W8I4X0_9FUNG|nr:37S ribosomal protein S9, mitochondrial [Coemansia guatemalensis]